MNIVHIVLGKANPNRMNGVNKVAHNLATAQSELGHNVNVFGLTNTKEKEKIKREYKISFYKRKKFYLSSTLKKDILMLPIQNTIFHIHGGFIIDFYFIAQFLKKYKYKYIFTSHGAYNEIALKKSFLIKKLYFSLFESSILKNAWKVQFLGKSEYEHSDNIIQGIYKVLIPNGQNINELQFNFTDIQKSNKPIFGFVGRVDSYTKGLDILFDAFLQYKENEGSGSLWIVGDGPDITKLKEFVQKYKLTNDILFFGSKYDVEKLNLLSNMDIFVHPSRNEGFPMSVLEAAGLSKPLILSKATNFQPYIEKYNAGTILDENNSSCMLVTLFEYEKKFDLNLLGIEADNSRDMVLKEFGWYKISRELIRE